MNMQHAAARSPAWLFMPASFGVLWNAYGLYQFIGSFSQTSESLMAAGMTAEQAALYLSLPSWVSIAFAIGVLGGLAGSIALLRRHALAFPVLALSLAGYIILFAADTYFGIFANIPAQLAILALVVAIAAALLWIAHRARNRGLLA